MLLCCLLSEQTLIRFPEPVQHWLTYSGSQSCYTCALGTGHPCKQDCCRDTPQGATLGQLKCHTPQQLTLGALT